MLPLGYVLKVFSPTNCTPLLFYSLSLLSSPSVPAILYFILCSSCVSLTLSLSVPFSCPFTFFSTHFVCVCALCVCIVWECLVLMHLALNCARSLVKPRQPCSTGRCLRTCVVPHRTAKTPLRLLQSALLRPLLRA